MSGAGVVGAYSRAEGETMALHAIGLASRRDERGLRDHLKAVLGRLGALGLPEAGVAPWFLTVMYLAPEVALDDTVVAILYERLWDRYGNDGVVAAHFFLTQGDIEAAKAIVSTLLQHRADDPEVRSLVVTCRLVSGLGGRSCGRPSA
jgi:hypothetical protein